MTDRELLELMLEKVNRVDDKINQMDDKLSNLDSDMKEVKRDIRLLKRNDDFILNEIERVHEIFDKKFDEINKRIS